MKRITVNLKYVCYMCYLSMLSIYYSSKIINKYFFIQVETASGFSYSVQTDTTLTSSVLREESLFSVPMSSPVSMSSASSTVELETAIKTSWIEAEGSSFSTATVKIVSVVEKVVERCA